MRARSRRCPARRLVLAASTGFMFAASLPAQAGDTELNVYNR